MSVIVYECLFEIHFISFCSRSVQFLEYSNFESSYILGYIPNLEIKLHMKLIIYCNTLSVISF